MGLQPADLIQGRLQARVGIDFRHEGSAFAGGDRALIGEPVLPFSGPAQIRLLFG